VSAGGGHGQGVCVIFNDKEQLLQTKGDTVKLFEK
jgi:hypothetical protein